MVNVKDLVFWYGDNCIFDGASFSIPDNSKVGLVGPNGAGKSTLLSLLSNKESPESGRLEVFGTVSMVPQEVKRDQLMEGSLTVRSYLDSDDRIPDRDLRKLLDSLELENLSLKDSPRELSGGQKTKLALARALLTEPDLLLLDEPTNFMDTGGKKWVMSFLSQYPKTLVLISHDLSLLDQHVDKVLEVNRHTRRIDQYSGNYSDYLKLKKERADLLRRRVAVEERHIKSMEEGLKKLARYSSEKGVRARTNLKHQIERAKERLPEVPPEVRRIKIRIPEPAWVGREALKAMGIKKSYGDKEVLSGLSWSINRGERVVILGRNGAGKSTLIKILMGLVDADAGEVKRGEGLKVGYYSQEFENFDLERTVIEIVRNTTDLPETSVRSLLAKLLFSGDKVFQKAATLSGGEKTRLSMALLLLQNYNLLILDEPTTYLDPMSQRIILEALKDYKGAMLLVSHTEEFVSELQPSRALILPGEEAVYWSPELLNVVGEV